MLITCPKCESNARIATSRAMTKETREAYYQCLNLNCGVAFITHTSVSKIIEQNVGSKPDSELQPELCKRNLDQIEVFPKNSY
ncbi:zinc-binding protein [Vibrio cholerae]|uniref:ogr/Delta-like zinc finger family protein n=1 Tax=Vibrio cholerae TaxID=666 RepID=UPI000BA9BE87|nr:ogr/Delta-like zinc finger family protein [Vibrio cholerae]PAS40207.1 zinc-binding protein [Vibrio cholerae]PAS45731.1 zinc-binding protein [Vibrio cholerae]